MRPASGREAAIGIILLAAIVTLSCAPEVQPSPPKSAIPYRTPSPTPTEPPTPTPSPTKEPVHELVEKPLATPLSHGLEAQATAPLSEVPAPREAPGGLLLDLLASAGWPEPLRARAVLVATCESHADPNAQSGPNKGLFQIVWGVPGEWGWAAVFGFPVDDNSWRDPLLNAQLAWRIVEYDRAQGYADFAQWPVCGQGW